MDILFELMRWKRYHTKKVDECRQKVSNKKSLKGIKGNLHNNFHSKKKMFSSATMQKLSRMMRGNFIEYNSEMALGGMRWEISCTYSCGSISNVRKTFKVKLFLPNSIKC